MHLHVHILIYIITNICKYVCSVCLCVCVCLFVCTQAYIFMNGCVFIHAWRARYRGALCASHIRMRKHDCIHLIIAACEIIYL
jgi:hypothetical protein